MEHVITDLRSTAARCSEFSERFDLDGFGTLSLRKAKELLGIASGEVLALHRRILTVHYQQLEAIFQHHPSELLSSKFEEILSLLKEFPTNTTSDDEEDDHDFLAGLVSFGEAVLPAIAERLEYLAAHIGVLATGATVHNVNITNSSVGAVAAGVGARASGRSSPRSSRRKGK